LIHQSPSPGAPLVWRTSWYGRELHGNRTASGDRFDPEHLTAAHQTLPLGTVLRVRNPRNGASVIVTVNDRGPFVDGRDLDLSLAAARRLGIVSPGIATVEVEILDSAGILDRQRASHE
jgi:rare lipoprotein A